MDGLSVAASLVGIGAVGCQIAIKLYTLATQISTASDRVSSISNDVSLTASVLQQLGELMKQKAADDGTSIFSQSGLETTRTSATMCENIFKAIEQAAKDASEQVRSRGRIIGKIKLSKSEKAKWPFLQPSIEALRNDLREAKGTLMLMLQLTTLAFSKKMADGHKAVSTHIVEQRDIIHAILELSKQAQVKENSMSRALPVNSSGNESPTEASSRSLDRQSSWLDGESTLAPSLPSRSVASLPIRPTVLMAIPTQGLPERETSTDTKERSLQTRLSNPGFEESALSAKQDRCINSPARSTSQNSHNGSVSTLTEPPSNGNEESGKMLDLFLMKPIIQDLVDVIQLSWKVHKAQMQQADVWRQVGRNDQEGHPAVFDLYQDLYGHEHKAIEDEMAKAGAGASLISLKRTTSNLWHRDIYFKGVPGLQFVLERMVAWTDHPPTTWHPTHELAKLASNPSQKTPREDRGKGHTLGDFPNEASFGSWADEMDDAPVHTASEIVDEKRKRNAGASSRFRQRRKVREHSHERRRHGALTEQDPVDETQAKAAAEEAEKRAVEVAEKKAAEAEAKAAAAAAAAAAAVALPPPLPPEERKKPVLFKDAGMEDLIRQAFLHVEIIGPHVAQGHYDLVGPDGAIILPQVWESTVQPDWMIIMQMWRMSESPPPPPPAPPEGAADAVVISRADSAVPPPPPPPGAVPSKKAKTLQHTRSLARTAGKGKKSLNNARKSSDAVVDDHDYRDDKSMTSDRSSALSDDDAVRPRDRSPVPGDESSVSFERSDDVDTAMDGDPATVTDVPGDGLPTVAQHKAPAFGHFSGVPKPATNETVHRPSYLHSSEHYKGPPPTWYTHVKPEESWYSTVLPVMRTSAAHAPAEDYAGAEAEVVDTGNGLKDQKREIQEVMTDRMEVKEDPNMIKEGPSKALTTVAQYKAPAFDENVFDETYTALNTSGQSELQQMEQKDRLIAEELNVSLATQKKRKRRKGAGYMQKECTNCHTQVTPEWRRGPSGNRDLCNSCGLRWAKDVSFEDLGITSQEKAEGQALQDSRASEEIDLIDFSHENMQDIEHAEAEFENIIPLLEPHEPPTSPPQQETSRPPSAHIPSTGRDSAPDSRPVRTGSPSDFLYRRNSPARKLDEADDLEFAASLATGMNASGFDPEAEMSVTYDDEDEEEDGGENVEDTMDEAEAERVVRDLLGRYTTLFAD
ncbi:MAG: hypothetical protein Q9207_006295 [Kuettlingeria erythrocarpa]